MAQTNPNPNPNPNVVEGEKKYSASEIRGQWQNLLYRTDMNPLRVAACSKLLAMQLQKLMDSAATLTHPQPIQELMEAINVVDALETKMFELAAHELDAQKDAGLIRRSEWLRGMLTDEFKVTSQVVKLVQALKL